MIRGLVSVIVLFGLSAQAQMLCVLPGTEDPLLLHFNAEFIQRNSVANVSGQNSVKRDGEPIREKNERSFYRFDATGRPTYTNTSYGTPGSGRDTASVTWLYNAQGKAEQQLRNDLNGHFMLRDSLDSLGRVVQESYVRIENLSNDRYDLIPGKETVISEEHFAYVHLNDTVLQKTSMNDRGLPYREQLFHTDAWGYLRAIDDHYLITGRHGDWPSASNNLTL
jgi:hypothetical protein